MVNIRGIKASLLIKPRAKSIEQKNSANMVACRETAGPSPIGSLKVANLELNSAIFGQPCVNIIKETPTRITKSAKSERMGEVEKKSFFISQINLITCGLSVQM